VKNHKPFAYQEVGINHLCSPLKASYLADKPGLGKTFQSLSAAKRLGAKSVLVVCPAAIVNQWQEEVKDFPGSMVVSYDAFSVGVITKEHRDALTSLRETLTHAQKEPKPNDINWRAKIHDLTRQIGSIERTMQRRKKAEQLRKRIRDIGTFDVIICDEAHLLKESGAHRTSYMFHGGYGMVKLGKKIMLLSGTPILNRPKELYAVLQACYPEAIHDCPNFEAFGYKFCGVQYGFNGSVNFNGCTNPEELGKRLKPFMIMRTLDVLGDKIPKVTYEDQYIPIEECIDAEHVATKRRLTGEAKVDKLVLDIKNVADKVKKLVVFYYHDSVRKSLQKAFSYAPLIKGGLTSFQKTEQIERFVRLGSDVILVQLGAGGVGLDGLQTVCSNGYLAELDWTPALEEQAVGRLRRLGQKHHVTIYRPVGTQHGLDQRIDEMNKDKTVVIESILSHVTQIGEYITMSQDLTPEVIEQLTRLADAAETIVARLTGEAAAPAKAKRGTAAPKAAPKAAGITHEQAREAIVGEMNAHEGKELVKKDAYKAHLKSAWGVENLNDVDADDLQKLVDSSISAMQEAASKKPVAATNDDI